MRIQFSDGVSEGNDKICREWPGGMMIDTGNGLIEIFTNAEGEQIEFFCER
ncbi:MAG: hypothetical protein J6X66_13715 [Lachnospiraceae bacterium]|nr:hypothetical protein [Lachnospiraceae bacterium]